jgi:hypothetical protein
LLDGVAKAVEGVHLSTTKKNMHISVGEHLKAMIIHVRRESQSHRTGAKTFILLVHSVHFRINWGFIGDLRSQEGENSV